MASSAQSDLSALLTGGASGMGLAVAQALAKRGGWKVHLLDLKPPPETVENATLHFHECDITNYDLLASVFQEVFDMDGRMDFVFSNAGIVERFDFFAAHPTGKPPPPPDQTVTDINFKAAVNVSWLAQHYFRQSKLSTNKNLIFVSSVGGLYRAPGSSIYAGTKHGLVGLCRSIAPIYLSNKEINARVNAICPGTVRTGLLEDAAWEFFPQDAFVPIEKVVSTVMMLVDGHDVGGTGLDGKPLEQAANVDGELLWGQVVELSGTKHYYRSQPAFCDGHMANCMKSTERTHIA